MMRLNVGLVGVTALVLIVGACATQRHGNGERPVTREDRLLIDPRGADSVVFLVDASGSMMGHMSLVLPQLYDAMDSLEPSTRFTVVVYSGDGVKEASGRGMRVATTDNKERVKRWLGASVKPFGPSSPMKALPQALGYEPALVCWVSDGVLGRGRHRIDEEAMAALIDDLRQPGGTRIDLYQVVSTSDQEVMERLAERTGGAYRHLDARALGVSE